MLPQYFKIAFRNLLKYPLFAALNIGGLAVGLAASLLLGLFVFDELRFDRFHENADRIVRVVFRADIKGGKIKEPFVMPPTAAALKNDYPEVLDASRLREAGTHTIVQDKQDFRGAQTAFVDANFFALFSLPLRAGNALDGLKSPNTVVISEEWATRVFGESDPLGRELKLKGWKDPLLVVGVMYNIPGNSHFQFDLFVSMAGIPEAKSDSWMQSEFYTYLLLPENYKYRDLEAKLPQTVEKYMGPQFQASLGMSFTDFKKQGNQIGLFLQPLTDIHLHSDFTFDLSAGGELQYVWIFGAIAVFILLIACINFMNLSTANAARRAKEVGVRKAVGATRSGLMWQFLTESMLITGISFVLALGLAALALPSFSELTGKQMDLGFLGQATALGMLLAFGLAMGILAGTYPAFFLSKFRPIQVLNGSMFHAQDGRGRTLRSSLVVLQFVISVSLIFGTLVVFQQLQFIQAKKLGYDREAVLVLENTGMLGEKEATLRAQLLQDPRVRHASISGYRPVGPSFSNNSLVYPDERADQMIRTLRYSVDEHYIPTLGMRLLSGRNFSSEMPTDSTAVILNQTAAKVFGWGDQAVGHQLHWVNQNARNITYQVIGVVEDFHFKSLHEPIAPLLMVLDRTSGIMLKIQAADVAGLLASVQEKWKGMGMDEPLEYAFMDDYYQKTYAAEQKTGLLMAVFAGLTIFVACLGLFGLAVFMSEQRTKEIGIRKVLGASVAGITGLLTKDFLKLVCIAILIACPIAYYFMDKWLADFVYRIDLQGWMFVAAALAAVLIAFLTVALQSVKAALANPVDSLRSE
jgi:putative ABC transport system permease protein